MIQRTKAAVRELDNLNYRKMKKILMIDSMETEQVSVDTEGDSTVSIQVRNLIKNKNTALLCRKMMVVRVIA